MYAGNSGEERCIPGHLTVNDIGPSVCECIPAVQPLWGCSVNRKDKKLTMNWLHIVMLSNLKTFHEYNLDDIVYCSTQQCIAIIWQEEWKRRQYIRRVVLHVLSS